MLNTNQFYQAGVPKVGNFVTVWDTRKISGGSSAANQIKFPMHDVNFTVSTIYWGDGSSDVISVWNSPLLTHTYAVAGVYIITVASKKFCIRASRTNDKQKLLEVLDWGRFNGGGTSDIFASMPNVDLSNCEGVPRFTACTSWFLNCPGLINIKGIEFWDFSRCNDFRNMFLNCSKFIGKGIENIEFGLAAQTLRGSMFEGCSKLEYVPKQLIVDSATNMFKNCISLNKPLSGFRFYFQCPIAGFMDGKSSANFNYQYYDEMLQILAGDVIGKGRTNAKQLGMGSIKYSLAGKPYRDALVTDGWVITDGGLI